MKNELAAALNFNDNKELPNSSFFFCLSIHIRFVMVFINLKQNNNTESFGNVSDRGFHVISPTLVEQNKKTHICSANEMKLKHGWCEKFRT